MQLQVSETRKALQSYFLCAKNMKSSWLLYEHLVIHLKKHVYSCNKSPQFICGVLNTGKSMTHIMCLVISVIPIQKY